MCIQHESLWIIKVGLYMQYKQHWALIVVRSHKRVWWACEFGQCLNVLVQECVCPKRACRTVTTNLEEKKSNSFKATYIYVLYARMLKILAELERHPRVKWGKYGLSIHWYDGWSVCFILNHQLSSNNSQNDQFISNIQPSDLRKDQNALIMWWSNFSDQNPNSTQIHILFQRSNWNRLPRK